MSDQSKGESNKQEKQCCDKCSLFIRQSENMGRCEFWKSMDVRPLWMEGEKIPAHPVDPQDGSDCEAFIPKDDGNADARQTWLFNNLTSLN